MACTRAPQHGKLIADVIVYAAQPLTIGVSISLLRDVPFSAIYFTAYAHLKKDLFREGENGKKLSFVQTLTAAGIAGTFEEGTVILVATADADPLTHQ